MKFYINNVRQIQYIKDLISGQFISIVELRIKKITILAR